MPTHDEHLALPYEEERLAYWLETLTKQHKDNPYAPPLAVAAAVMTLNATLLMLLEAKWAPAKEDEQKSIRSAERAEEAAKEAQRHADRARDNALGIPYKPPTAPPAKPPRGRTPTHNTPHQEPPPMRWEENPSD